MISPKNSHPILLISILTVLISLSVRSAKTYTHFNYICPLPKNTSDILRKYKKIVVCELNNGQFASYLRSQFPECPMQQYNKIMGLPFEVGELKECFTKILGE